MPRRVTEAQVAAPAVRRAASAAAEPARIEWHTVGDVCARACADLGAAYGRGRLDGVRCVGVDGTSRKRGRKRLTVVIDHDRGCLIWAHEGCGKGVPDLFPDEPACERRRAMEVVTADGAKRTEAPVRRGCPSEPHGEFGRLRDGRRAPKGGGRPPPREPSPGEGT